MTLMFPEGSTRSGSRWYSDLLAQTTLISTAPQRREENQLSLLDLGM